MASKLMLELPSGRTKTFVHYRGLTYGDTVIRVMSKDFAEHIEDVVNLDIRDDDVYLATYPKSGTHWMWEILVMLRKGTTVYEENVKAFTMLDFRSVDDIDSLPPPRVLNCHFPAKLTPKQVFEKGTKVVVVHRNFKDVVVSAYHHLQQLQPKEDKDIFPEFVQLTLGKFGFYSFVCSWAQYVKDWEEMSKRYPGQILTLYFEDMKEDPVREITKVDKFLGTERDEQLISDIAKACDFHNLKKADENKKHIFLRPSATGDDTESKSRLRLYRKGQVGDWKNHLTVRDNEEIDQWLSENMVDTSFNFRYTL